MKATCLVLFLTLVTVACKKDKAADDHGAAPAAAGAPKPADLPAGADKMPAPFKTWDLAARAKAWQGAWVSEQSLGFPIALAIAGDKATAWDGKAEKHLDFALESPCSATLTEKHPDGSSEGTTSHFTIKDGKLIEGLGDAGTRKGKSAIACVSNRVLTLDDAGTCLAWTSMFGDWKSEPGKCGFAQKDGKEVFTSTIDNHESSMLVDGDALLSDQLAQKSSKSYPDFAAAKAARDAAKP